MGLVVLSIVGVTALGGGVAAGLSALVVAAAAWLFIVGLLNAIRLLGQLLEALEVSGPTDYQDGGRLRSGSITRSRAKALDL